MKGNSNQQSAHFFAKASRWQIIVLTSGVLIALLFIGWVLLKSSQERYSNKLDVNGTATLYYTQAVNDSIGSQIAEGLKNSNYLKSGKDQSFLLDMRTSHYELKVQLSDVGLLSDTAFVNLYSGLEWTLNESLSFSAPVEIKFVDKKRSMEFLLPDLKKKSINEYPHLNSMIERHIGLVHTLYYTPGIPEQDIEKVEQTIERLKAYFPDKKEVNILFLEDGGVYRMKFFEDRKVLFSPAYMKQIRNAIEYLRQSGIDKKIHLSLIDQHQFYEREVL